MTEELCFFCRNSDIPEDSWELEAIKMVHESFKFCDTHNAFCLTKIDELSKQEPKKYVLKTGEQKVYKPSPIVKKTYMEFTEREPGSDDE